MSYAIVYDGINSAATEGTNAYMDNARKATNENGAPHGIPADKRTIYQAVAIALSLAVMYVTFALVQYNWFKSDCRRTQSPAPSRDVTVRKGRKKDSGGTSDSSTSTARSPCRPKSQAARQSKILRVMCVCASVLTFARLACEQIEILPAQDARVNCRDYQIAMVITYGLAITMLYAILWYRVRVFLSHPAMRHLGSKVLTVLAFVTLGIIVVASVVNVVMFLATTVSHDDVGGCVVESPGDKLPNSDRFAIMTVSTVVSQVSLLGLFLYPLVRHSATMRGRNTSSQVSLKRSEKESIRTVHSSVKNIFNPGAVSGTLTRRRNTPRRQKREKALLKIIRRVMITAVICAVSDIFCGLIVRLATNEPRIVTNLVFDVNLVVNLACVLMSFKDWRVRMFPCCVRRRKAPPDEKQVVRRPVSSQDRRFKFVEAQVPSSPAVFTSRESTTQGIYPTSESGVNSPSPREEDSGEKKKDSSGVVSASEDMGNEKSVSDDVSPTDITK